MNKIKIDIPTGTRQAKEIETVKERTFRIKLSDSDLHRLCAFSVSADTSIEKLLQDMIGDLVGGTYSHGSDEREIMQEWYDRAYSVDYDKLNERLDRI